MHIAAVIGKSHYACYSKEEVLPLNAILLDRDSKYRVQKVSNDIHL